MQRQAEAIIIRRTVPPLAASVPESSARPGRTPRRRGPAWALAEACARLKHWQQWEEVVWRIVALAGLVTLIVALFSR